MRTGRPPKPTALHNLHGTARKDRHAKRAAEPVPLGDLTDAPDWFTPSQREGWEYAIRHCPRGVLKLLDRTALVLWVEAEDRHRGAMIAQATLNRRAPDAPWLVKGPDGLIMSPYVEIMDRAAKIIVRMMTELGFSPVARPRIRVVLAEQPAGQDKAPDPRVDPWKHLAVIKGGKTG
jgi:P27 family predicted phage terminase small subunit